MKKEYDPDGDEKKRLEKVISKLRKQREREENLDKKLQFMSQEQVHILQLNEVKKKLKSKPKKKFIRSGRGSIWTVSGGVYK